MINNIKKSKFLHLHKLENNTLFCQNLWYNLPIIHKIELNKLNKKDLWYLLDLLEDKKRTLEAILFIDKNNKYKKDLPIINNTLNIIYSLIY